MSCPRTTALLAALALSACSSTPDAPALNHPAVASIDKYVVSIPASAQLPYSGAYTDAFGKTMTFAPGSGLAYRGKDAEGRLLFYGIGDRGPNGDSPKVFVGDKGFASKVFPVPTFIPRFAEIVVTPGKGAALTRTVPIGFDSGPASGLPIASGKTGSTGEVALTDKLATLGFDANGIDPESIAIDKDGNLWISDEYGPFLMKLDRNGNVLAKYEPGKGLPTIIGARQPNRGFEGATVTPSGKIVAIVQSTLDVDGKTKDSASFTRIVELDPKTGTTRQFAYSIDMAHYLKAGDAKLGDIVAIDDTHFALIDQGAGKNGMRNLIVIIDIAGATDISNIQAAGGKALEYATPAELAAVKFVRAQTLLDMRDLGWTPEKTEGLAIVDGKLAVINDNDFGISSSVAGDKGDKMGAYSVKDGKLTDNGRYSIAPNGENTQLWILTLRAPLQSYFPK
ncbi:MAG: esterase-like activity of phytase family protein [Rhodocyclaceae bacterium]